MRFHATQQVIMCNLALFFWAVVIFELHTNVIKMASLDVSQMIVSRLIWAGRNNDIDELQCLLAECKAMDSDTYDNIKDNEFIAENTSSCGSVECLQALLEEDFNMRLASGVAAESGHVECLELLIEYGEDIDPWCWLHAVAGKSQLGSWKTNGGGHLDVLRLLCENECERPDVVDQPMVIIEAVGGGHMECLDFLIECGFAWSDSDFKNVDAGFDVHEYINELKKSK